MKKVYIITFHQALSYGALFQTYALQKYLLNNNINSEVINYVPKRFTLFGQLSAKRKNKNIVNSLIFIINRIVLFTFMRIFQKKNLILTKEIFSNEFELQKYTFQSNIFITGSDQVWNLDLDDFSLIKPYFLSFTSNEAKKISYAASIGSYSLPSSSEITQIKDLLGRYHAISVREDHAKNELQSLINKRIDHVLDPTFLLEKKDWLKISKLNKYKKYILVYGLYRNKLLYQISNKYANQTGFKIINIADSFDIHYGAKNIIMLSYEKILGLIMQAELVITDSFHGCALSLNFNTPFYLVKAKRANSRIESLCRLFDISERILIDVDCLPDDYSFNFTHCNEVLEKKRKESTTFLLRSIGL